MAIITKKLVNEISYTIVGCAIEVHKTLGPGLLESVYHNCMKDEMRNWNLKFESQVWVPVSYKGKDLGGKFRLDFLVEDLIIVELKAVDNLIPLYQAQLLSYLRLANKPKGLLINFHSENIVSQLIPLVTEKFALLPEK
ncbi:MAG TPA: GxxExxY protein [Bacteroidales bacterium]|nr:GxxExxY protein [Bacteroidales bacterium]HPT01698.1 GxxExxY protein [Bacteroidales bacterium]